MSTATSPLTKGAEPITWNFKLLAQNDLGGFGGMGEGMSVQIAKDGRRIIWLAHESAPKNFTAVDVSDPRKPKIVVQTDLPKPYMRSNSLELSGDIMAVAYQSQKVNQQPAGLELFDVSVPEKPRSISFFDCSGATFARRTSIVVLRRPICAYGGRRAPISCRAIRSTTSSTVVSTFAIRRSRSRSAAGGCRAPARRNAAAAAPQARQGLSRAQHQCLQAARRPALSLLYRWRHVRDGHRRQVEAEADFALDQFAALYRFHAHRPCRCSTAGF